MSFWDHLKPKARAEPEEKQPAERLILENTRRADWIGNQSESICAAAPGDLAKDAARLAELTAAAEKL